MPTATPISVAQLIGYLAISVNDGERVHTAIYDALQDPAKTATVDFSGVTIFTSVFFNVAIGRLYGQFSPEDLSARLTIVNLADSEQDLLQLVIRNAKEYFTNPAVREAVDSVFRRYEETGDI